ncbi:hypothetical protein O181_020906 [Austropuccinia psidii MF-1]|uniref:Uncharacterized protein n=1 Tax=Austropuccinia psidii MF-1 TaxID=1389203 RepID=A0A9Q3CEE4_9BASI|nr:hypothetical protein [Austropuccinia psidii MF-1]
MTVEELLKEVELDILRKSGTEDQSSLALQLLTKPKKKDLLSKGNNNPLSNHSEILGSGCSYTIASTSDHFSKITTSNETLLESNGSYMKVTSEGTFQPQTTTGNISITNALIVPLASPVLA